MEILMYLLFLSIGFGLGVVCSLGFFSHRVESTERAPVTMPPLVQINVSAELVARYLDTFNLIAIPKDLVIGADEPITKH